MPRQFKEKVERYFAYDVSGRFTERYHGQRFRVLVVTNTPERLRNLKRTAAQTAQRYCWFATFADSRARGPFAAIWETVANRVRVTLIDPH